MRWIFALIVLSMLLALCCGRCDAQGYRLAIDMGNGHIGKGTCVCIGKTTDGKSLFVTAKHNFEDSERAWIFGTDWKHRVTDVHEHPSVDVAVFEVEERQFRFCNLGEPELGSRVEIFGYGPEFRDVPGNTSFSGIWRDDHVAGEGGAHPIPGDSGGPVVKKGASGWQLVGVVSGYSPAVSVTTRNDRAADNLQTIVVPVTSIQECLSQCYQYRGCPPGGCPIYVRPQIQQPMIGIGIPVGPPRVVGVAEPAPVVQQSAIPDLSPVVRQSVRDWLEANREQLRGDAGPPGHDGRSVSKSEAESIISTWLEANREQLRGEPGPAGRDGVDGQQGERGMIGVPSEEEIAAVIDLWIQRNDPRIREFVKQVVREEFAGDMDARVTALEARRLRMMIVDGKAKTVIDDETYGPGEPVILDLRRFTTVEAK